MTDNETKSKNIGSFIRTLKGEIYNKMTSNDSKSHLCYLNKVVDEYKNMYFAIGKKPVHADYSASSEEFESGHKAYKFKVGD